MADQSRGPAPAGSTWTAQPDREAQLAARVDALAMEHGRVKQDKPETRASALPQALRPAPPVSSTGSTTWSQAKGSKRPGDDAIEPTSDSRVEGRHQVVTTTAAERIAMQTATEAAAWIESRRSSRSVVYAVGQPVLPLSEELWQNRPDVRRFGMAAVSAACADKVNCCRWGLAMVHAMGHREPPPRQSPALRAFLGAPCSACLRHEQAMHARRVDGCRAWSATAAGSSSGHHRTGSPG
jgi:hypothetical protein